MTNERACANNTPQPIQEWENENVKGEALSRKRFHEEHLAEVNELRQRQEAYIASLPKNPSEALTEIHSTLLDPREIGEQHYAPRAALEIIHQLALKNGLEDDEGIRDAIYWLTSQALNGLNAIDAATQQAQEIAGQFHPRYEPYKA